MAKTKKKAKRMELSVNVWSPRGRSHIYTETPQRVDINAYQDKLEVIIHHNGRRLRILCDSDAIHVGGQMEEKA